MSAAKGARAGKKVAEAIERRAKKKKKSESPPSARRDMAKKDVFTGQKYMTGGPKTMKRMTPEYRSFLNKQAKKETKEDKRKAMALAGATGAALAGATMIGAKKEKERLEKIKNKKDGGWIQKAIKKPGALKQQLGVPKDEKIPAKKLNAAAKKGGKLGQRARLAKTLRGFKNGGEVTKWENKWG